MQSKTKSVSYKGRCATFQSSMKLTIVIGQCFGLLPVVGVSDIDTSKLSFSYISARCFYTILSILGQITLFIFCLLKFFKDSSTSLGSKTSLIFFSSNFIKTIMFMRIASKWPGLCQQISLTEARDPIVNAGLIDKCNMYCIGILVMALVEHALCDLSGLVAIFDCRPEDDHYEHYILNSFPWLFDTVTYSPIVGSLALFCNIQCTFNWNYADIFIICISLYLTERLDRVHKRIMETKGHYTSPAVWRFIREEYNVATCLVRHMDDVISCITLISFANNLFFICIQMLHLLQHGIKPTTACHYPDKRPLQGYEQPIYFLYSLTLLIIRWLAVSLIAAEVHTASRRPLYALYEVPSAGYCPEVQRLIDQIHGDTIALSGLQFFKVKRGLVLTIAGTIATYELVLLQFAGVTPSDGE